MRLCAVEHRCFSPCIVRKPVLSVVADLVNSETSSQLRRPLCSPERETGTLKIGFSDMMCDVGNAAIKDAIANIARNREVLHFLSCIARFLGHFSGLPTRTKPLARRTLPRMANPALLE